MLSQMSQTRTVRAGGNPGCCGGDAPPSGGQRPATLVQLEAVAPLECRGERFDRAAARLFPAISRSELAAWIKSGAATLDGRRVKPRLALRGGERIRVVARRTPRTDWRATDEVAFRIVHRDADVIVVDKPPGVVVHPGAGNPRGTLVNGLLGVCPQLADLPRAGLVHRLDKNTSGLLVVAVNAESQLALGRALLARRIERRYLAVAEGRMIAGERVDLALGRDPRHRLRQAVRADGRPAVTHVRVRERFAAHTLLEARLETGRTHQIRVHMAAIGHPLVGDRRYGARGVVPPDATPAQAAAVRRFARQALHAWRLGFTHPTSGQALAFTAPPPADLRGLAAVLGVRL